MKNEMIKAEEFGIEESKAVEITQGLNVTIDERKLLIEEFDIVKDLEVTKENIPTFKALRLKIVKNRTQGITNWHKANKNFFLVGGRFVDAIKNKEIQVNESMEEVLSKAEKHFENIEKERIELLRLERVDKLSKYVEGADKMNLGKMEEFVFETYLKGAKATFEEKIASEKKAEDERLAKEKAEKEERERIAKENEKLKREAEERERLQKIEDKKRAKIEYDRIAKEEAEANARKLERERIEKEQQEALRLEREKADKIKADAEAEQKKLRDELKAKEEAEAKAIQKAKEEAEAKEKEKAALIQSELNKGDAEKVKDLKADFELLKTKYSFKSAKNKKMLKNVCELIDKVVVFIDE